MIKTPSTLLLITLLSTPHVKAWFRLPCNNSPLVIERVDPIVAPGGVASHVHTVVGGSAFDQTINWDKLRASTCTSCGAVDDSSVYWTSLLYFQNKDSTYTPVSQIGGAQIDYIFDSNPSDKAGGIVAFPRGLRMLAGNSKAKSDDKSLMTQAIGWNCILNGGSTRTSAFPVGKCDMIRSEIRFPSCWNGKDIDSSDHQSHVKYPNQDEEGTCQQGFTTRIPTLRIETTWNSGAFNYKNALNPNQPYVLSTGDNTGFSAHGDFHDGWKDNVLQSAINKCPASDGNIRSCTVLKLGTGVCQKTQTVKEDVLGTTTKLRALFSTTNNPNPQIDLHPVVTFSGQPINFKRNLGNVARSIKKEKYIYKASKSGST